MEIFILMEQQKIKWIDDLVLSALNKKIYQ